MLVGKQNDVMTNMARRIILCRMFRRNAGISFSHMHEGMRWDHDVRPIAAKQDWSLGRQLKVHLCMGNGHRRHTRKAHWIFIDLIGWLQQRELDGHNCYSFRSLRLFGGRVNRRYSVRVVWIVYATLLAHHTQWLGVLDKAAHWPQNTKYSLFPTVSHYSLVCRIPFYAPISRCMCFCCCW